MSAPEISRRGLVLGGGGVLGGTWAVGALTSLEQDLGVSMDSFEIIVGTSAGSVLGALLTSGVSLSELRDHYDDHVVTTGPLAGFEFDPDEATGGHRPGRPKLNGPGSPALIRETLRHLGKVPPTAALSAFLPAGGRNLDRIAQLVTHARAGNAWPSKPELWVVAMDYQDAHRVVFGRPGAPVASLDQAVVASCAIPGWFAPVSINGRSYVDGGALSATSVDVLEHVGLDEIFVVAPMVSFEMDVPDHLSAKLERRWRTEVTKACCAEAAKVAATGTQVHVIGPGPEDLVAIGANLMDASRRSFVLHTALHTSPKAWENALVREAC
jgi:NTE family protein